MATPDPASTTPAVPRSISDLVVIPLGSWEQHGPHLPFDTDTRIAQELVSRLEHSLPELVRGPTLTVSASGEHAGFRGTLSIGGEVVTKTVIELVRSADWSSGVVFVNGHGGNSEYLARAVDVLAREGRSILVWSPPLVDDTDSHAGLIETSLMLAIDPASVRIDEIREGVTEPLGTLMADLRLGGVISVSPSGVLGDPRGANPDLGRALLDDWAQRLLTAVSAWAG